MIIIAGPCQLESKEHAEMIALKMQSIQENNGFKYVFKSSFDKANRKSLKSKRGLGLQDSIKIVRHIQSLNIETLTDVQENKK